MRKLTRLLSGTAASAALLSAPAMAEGADIASHLSQPIYIVDQYLYEDVHASIITDIEDYSAEVSSNVIGLGNTASAWVENGDLNSVMSQTLGATVTAENLIDGGTAGHVSASTLAYGNSGSSGTIWGANQHFANQIAYADIEAHAHIDMQGAYTIASTSSAIANVSASMNENGETAANHIQSSQGSVTATTDADMCCDGGAAVFTTMAGANAISLEGSATTSQTEASQATTMGEAVVASSDVYIWDGHNVHNASSAFGNSATVYNAWGYATLGQDGSELRQDNASDITSETYVTLDHWSGTATATAYGLGNSALMSNIGSDTSLYSTQINTGDVLAQLDFNGQSWTGGAGIVTATAMGNAASASLCNYCGDATLQGRVHQTNHGQVTASAHITASHSGSVHGTVAAIGNASTFTATGP